MAASEVILTEAVKSQDPIFIGLAFVLSVVVLLVAVAKPIMSLVKDYKSTGVDSAKASAESALFEQLRQQILTNSDAIGKLIAEKNVWFEKALILEHEVERLKVFEKMVNSMRDRLTEKDKKIDERDEELRELTRRMLEMKDSIHALEMRLANDEKSANIGCRRFATCKLRLEDCDGDV
jgi:hypothetical protein